MSPRIFTVKGRVVHAGGEPAAGVWVAIVDADPELDDLLGAGRTDADGALRLSFTADAFNQEPDEVEERPDVYVVVSIATEAGLVPLLRQDVPGLTFAGEEDLGTIVLPMARGAAPVAVEGLRPIPGRTKIVRRTRLDLAIVEHAARDVAPLVERLTGWSDLLDGVAFAIVDDFRDIRLRQAARALGKDVASLTAGERERATSMVPWLGAHAAAEWAASERTIHVNRTILEAQNVDGLRLVLAHELVHVGQSRAHPAIDEAYQTALLASDAHDAAGTLPSRAARRAHTQLVANVEGYATFIEKTMAQTLTHGMAILGARHRALARRAERAPAPPSTRPETATWLDVLEEDAIARTGSADALAAYQALAAVGASPRFDPALGLPFAYDRARLDDLERAATGGDADAQTTLGLVLLHGMGGVPRDATRAARWLRLGADAGVASAAEALASITPVGIPELEAAATAGDVAAMRALADAYEHGAGVGRDRITARLWKNRADAAERQRLPRS